VVIVEGVTAKPAIGWTIAGAGCATLWVKDIPEWAKGAPRIKARSAKAGAITVEATPATPATLYLITGK
jgi:hypothetical protein